MDISALAGVNWVNLPIQDDKKPTTPINILAAKPSKWRRITLMATISSSTINTVDIQRMLEAGLNIIKFRMATSTIGDKLRILKKIKAAEQLCCEKNGVSEWPIATAIALKTSVRKTGFLKGDAVEIELNEGNKVILTNNKKFFDKCDTHLIFVETPNLVDETEIGSNIYIDSDELVLKCVEKIDDTSIKCVVTVSGFLRSLRTVCISDVKFTNEALTPIDYQLVKFAIENKIDLITLDYCRNVHMLKELKKMFVNENRRPLIFVGIGTPSDLENIDEFLMECDGLEISRDILPYELPASQKYRWMLIQKWIFAKCELAGKPCFLTGGVFKSTVTSGIVFERELSDMTNALMDGATGLCLKDSENTDYTVDVLKLMNEICCHLEPHITTTSDLWRLSREIQMPANAAMATISACVFCATTVNAQAIIIPTVSGKTAQCLFWMKPTCVVITVSSKTNVTRCLYTYRNIVPLKYEAEEKHAKYHTRIANRINYALLHAVNRGLLLFGDIFVVLRRGNEMSNYCDTITIEHTHMFKKAKVECDP